MTDRGRPVALLVPYKGDEWRALLDSGRITSPATEGDVVDEALDDYGVDASGALAAVRENER